MYFRKHPTINTHLSLLHNLCPFSPKIGLRGRTECESFVRHFAMDSKNQTVTAADERGCIRGQLAQFAFQYLKKRLIALMGFGFCRIGISATLTPEFSYTICFSMFCHGLRRSPGEATKSKKHLAITSSRLPGSFSVDTPLTVANISSILSSISVAASSYSATSWSSGSVGESGDRSDNGTVAKDSLSVSNLGTVLPCYGI